MITSIFDNFDTNAIRVPIENPLRKLSIGTGIVFMRKLPTVFRMANQTTTYVVEIFLYVWHSRKSYVNFDAIWIGSEIIDFGHLYNTLTNMVDNFRIKTILVPIES